MAALFLYVQVRITPRSPAKGLALHNHERTLPGSNFEEIHFSVAVMGPWGIPWFAVWYAWDFGVTTFAVRNKRRSLYVPCTASKRTRITEIYRVLQSIPGKPASFFLMTPAVSLQSASAR